MQHDQTIALKSRTEAELIASILGADPDWSEVERARILEAYELARDLHRNDLHKDKPYIYHLLRVANRITAYLHVLDAEIVTAAILHDSAEDHADGLIGTNVPEDDKEQQQLALERLADRFTPRTAELVAMVTNAPHGSGPKPSYNERMDIYVNKVKSATKSTDGWVIKFSDWCDNGLGIIHMEEPADMTKLGHFAHKYGLVLSIFETRFKDDDIQSLLDDEARDYVRSQLKLGHERLG
jgi:(p)ppGpp synthase/HD superfamily hydrolase